MARARFLSLDSGRYVGSGSAGMLARTNACSQPFNHAYLWDNVTDNYSIHNDTNTVLNTYMGGVYQQATSALSWTSEYG